MEEPYSRRAAPVGVAAPVEAGLIERIAYITNFRQGEGGGVGRVAYELAGQFNSLARTLLVCPGEETGPGRSSEGLPLFTLSSSGEGSGALPDLSLANLRQLFDYLDEFQPQVVHAHDAAWLGLVGQVWARMRQVPFAFTAHLLPWRMVEFGNRAQISIPWPELAEDLLEEYLQQFMDGCDTVVALNQGVARGLRAWGYGGRLDIIPNGRDLARFSGLRNASLTDPVKKLVFTGFLSERKNQEFLLEVMACLPPEYRLQLVGEPLEAEYLALLQERIDQLGLANVDLAGGVPFEEIPGVLAGAHLVVSASLHEVQSLAVIEALASGTPVVGLSNETVDELVDGRVGARLPKEASPEEFARQVQAICALTQAEYDKLCAQARRRVRSLDWEHVARLTGRMYAELVGSASLASRQAEPDSQARLESLEALVRREQVPETIAAGLLDLQARLERVRRVPAPTWFYTALNILGASLLKTLFKS